MDSSWDLMYTLTFSVVDKFPRWCTELSLSSRTFRDQLFLSRCFLTEVSRELPSATYSDEYRPPTEGTRGCGSMVPPPVEYSIQSMDEFGTEKIPRHSPWSKLNANRRPSAQRGISSAITDVIFSLSWLIVVGCRWSESNSVRKDQCIFLLLTTYSPQ